MEQRTESQYTRAAGFDLEPGGGDARQRFLLAFTDRLRALADPLEIQYAAARTLGEHLGASRVGYAEIEADQAHSLVTRNFTQGVRSIEGRYRVADYSPALIVSLRAGRTTARDDVAGDATLSDVERANHAALEIGASVDAPILRGGRLVAVLFAHHRASHAWTPEELSIVEAAASRTWDAVERARAEVALRESESKYRSLFASMDEGVCILRLEHDATGALVDWCYVETNPAFERHTGLVNAAGRNVSELVPGIERIWYEQLGRVGRTGEPARFIERVEELGRWFDIHAFRVGEDGDRRVAVLFTDVTERQLAELERERLLAALEVERARLAHVFQQAPAFMVVLRGPTHVLELVNDAYQQLVGHRDILGKPLFDALPEARGQGFEEKLDAVLATGVPYIGRALPVRLQRTPGAALEERFIDLSYVPLSEADDARSGIVVLGTDVTEQVHTRREIEQARDRAERLQSLTAALAGARTFDDVADVVVAEMVVVLGARTGALASLAADGEALELLRTVGFPEPVVARVQRQPLTLRTPLTECFRTRQPLWIETREGPDGLDERFPPIAMVWDALGVGSAAFIPLVAAGESVGAISFAYEGAHPFSPTERDFLLALGRQAAQAFERARLLAAERAARQDAEHANRAKGEFLAVMSHELRTPLNAIGGYAELMEMGIHGPVTPQQVEDLHRIQASQRHLLGLINQVLNYTRVDAGVLRYDVVDVPVGEALATAEALVVPQIRARGLSYALGGVSPTLLVRADREKLQQVLLNLLGNAIKFTEPGGEIRVHARETEDAVAITVEDTGIGIAGEKLASIFEPFVQVDQRLTRPHEGVGLGLAISRDLARGMGGDLLAESRPGSGSTFTLTLPRTQTII